MRRHTINEFKNEIIVSRMRINPSGNETETMAADIHLSHLCLCQLIDHTLMLLLDGRQVVGWLVGTGDWRWPRRMRCDSADPLECSRRPVPVHFGPLTLLAGPGYVYRRKSATRRCGQNNTNRPTDDGVCRVKTHPRPGGDHA